MVDDIDYEVGESESIVAGLVEQLGMVERMKLRLSEDELIGMVVKHARNSSSTLAKPYIFYLLEKYGVGEDSGLADITSRFIGVEKDETWEVEEDEDN